MRLADRSIAARLAEALRGERDPPRFRRGQDLLQF